MPTSTVLASWVIGDIPETHNADPKRVVTAAFPTPATLTGATVLFTSLDSGKDDGSALTAQLLRNGNEVAAEVRRFIDGHATAP